MAISPRALINKLNPHLQGNLRAGASPSPSSRTHFNIEIEHWLIKLLEAANTDLTYILRQYAIDAAKVKRELEQSLNVLKTGQQPAGGHRRRDPRCHPRGVDLWLARMRRPSVRSAYLLAALLATRTLRDRIIGSSPELGRISVEKLQADLKDLLPRVASKENDQEAAAAAVAGPGGGASTGSCAARLAAARLLLSTSSPSTSPPRPRRAGSTPSSAATTKSARSSTSSPAAARTTRSSPARPASARRPWSKDWPCASSAGTCPSRSRTCSFTRSTSDSCRPAQA